MISFYEYYTKGGERQDAGSDEHVIQTECLCNFSGKHRTDKNTECVK